MSKAILIDSAARELKDVEFKDHHDLHKLVSGYLEIAWSDASGDVLFVDEDGLSKPQRHFFRWRLRANPQPIAGNGVIVGRELLDEEGEWIGNADPKFTTGSAREQVQFLSREQVDAWARGNASEPFAAVRMGRGPVHVLERVGPAFAAMPRPDDPAPKKPASGYRGFVAGPLDFRIVTRDDSGNERPLPWCLNVVNHSPTGFAWGYLGSGPAQVALAILCDALQDTTRAIRLHQQFKIDRIAKLNGDAGWEMSRAEVVAWAAGQQRRV